MESASPNLELVFAEAIAIKSPEDRAAFLEQACQGDTHLLGEIKTLVHDHFRAGSFLERPVAQIDPALSPPIAEAPGSMIGPYKLLEQIGEGGMGTVWMAEQAEPVARKVALKIVKPGMDSRQVIGRFEAERQALALMDHPNISKILDAGATDSGRPYFVMELVNGIPIIDYCDQHRLTTRKRLELFITVCQAVQHAHQKGIIHRDLKPTNILVADCDNHAVAKIIDFGVAKAIGQQLTERTMLTEFGQVIGTVEYMSPEQAKLNQLDIDTRTDIYSLGVLLYELVAGETPFDRERLRSAAFDEMLRIIREEEPPTLSTRLSTSQSLASIAANRQLEPQKLAALVRGDLDWIVFRAMEKDRSRRYETAAALASDIQRHLADEPVEARQPTRAYRLKKFVRRNKLGVLATSAIALALAVGMILASAGFIQARRQAAIARTQATRALQVQHFLQGMLGSINPDTGGGGAVTVQQVLDRAASKVETEFADQPETRAVLHETIGRTYRGLQLLEPSMQQLQMAVDLRRRYLPDEPLALAEAEYSLAVSQYQFTMYYPQALANCREAIAIFSQNLPATDFRLALARALESHLSELISGSRQKSAVRAAAILPIVLAFTDEQLQRMPEDFVRAVGEARRLHANGDDAAAGTVLQQYRAATFARLRELCRDGQQDAARSDIRQHYLQMLDVPVFGQLIPLSLVVDAEEMKSNGEDSSLVEAMLREAVVAADKLWGGDHPHTAWALADLAGVLEDEGRLAEAESTARAALAMRRKLFGNGNPSTLESLRRLADILQRQGKTAEAEALRGEAAGATEKRAPDSQPQPENAQPKNGEGQGTNGDIEALIVVAPLPIHRFSRSRNDQ
jgi:serine/threonine protein kinase